MSVNETVNTELGNHYIEGECHGVTKDVIRNVIDKWVFGHYVIRDKDGNVVLSEDDMLGDGELYYVWFITFVDAVLYNKYLDNTSFSGDFMAIGKKGFVVKHYIFDGKVGEPFIFRIDDVDIDSWNILQTENDDE